MKTQETIIRQPYTVTMMRPSVCIYTETDKKGHIIRREKAINPIDMKLRYKALQSIQHIFAGLKVNNNNEDFYKLPTENLVAKIDVSHITNYKHYSDVDASAKKMMNLAFDVPDKGAALHQVHMLQEMRREKGSKTLYLTFTAGFLKYLAATWGWVSFYDADIICSLKNVSTMKMYELVARRDKTGKPVVIPFATLKEITLQDGRYEDKTSPYDFDRYVLDKAKQELDNSSPYSFTYRREKIEGEWTYFILPIHIPANEPVDALKNNLAGQISLGLEYPKAKQILVSKNYYGFTKKELQPHHDLLFDFEQKTGRSLATFLLDRYEVAATKKDPKAWILGAVRKLVKDSENNC